MWVVVGSRNIIIAYFTEEACVFKLDILINYFIGKGLASVKAVATIVVVFPSNSGVLVILTFPVVECAAIWSSKTSSIQIVKDKWCKKRIPNFLCFFKIMVIPRHCWLSTTTSSLPTWSTLKEPNTGERPHRLSAVYVTKHLHRPVILYCIGFSFLFSKFIAGRTQLFTNNIT